ncbi:MAG TPA: hypothetical protein VIG99_24115 [Myxococcaceae bacterium]
MRIVLASAGADLFAFESRQLGAVLGWPLVVILPWGSLHALAGIPVEEWEPRALLARSAGSGEPFVLRVPGPLREEDVAAGEIHPVPPLLSAPAWVRGIVLRDGATAVLLDLPALGDAVLSSAISSPSPAPEALR